MKRVIVIIGACASGKTTYRKEQCGKPLFTWTIGGARCTLYKTCACIGSHRGGGDGLKNSSREGIQKSLLFALKRRDTVYAEGMFLTACHKLLAEFLKSLPVSVVWIWKDPDEATNLAQHRKRVGSPSSKAVQLILSQRRGMARKWAWLKEHCPEHDFSVLPTDSRTTAS